MMQDKQVVVLKLPISVTAAGVTGSWVDLQGYITSPANVKAILSAGPGSAVGTCGGYIQVASTTAGSDAATITTFSTQTSAGGVEEKHFVTTKRYARFVGTVQSTKTMILGCNLVAEARFTP